MGKSIGLDFGTTYSVIAELTDPEGGDFTPRTATIKNEESKKDNYYDSIVLRIDDHLYCADEAREIIGDSDDFISYSGFKLLLAESTDSELLKDYDEKYMPSDIVEEYLKYLLGSYRDVRGEKIDRLVVGVPDVWMYEKQNGCYGTLLNIVEKMDIAAQVDFLSEPEAAAAYWADNYKIQNKGEGYEGTLLLIDYGGGTLDICMPTIKNVDGNPEIDIDPQKRSGAGANTNKEIGQAGQAYMKRVIELALKQAGISNQEIETLGRIGAIDKGVYQMEDNLKKFSANGSTDETIQKFKRKFKKIDKNKLERMIRSNKQEDNAPVFNKPIWVKGKKCEVTYKIIAQAYYDEIWDVLDESMKKILPYVPEHSFSSNNFKVQLIGGFSNFYLVEEQIKSILGITTSANEEEDQRFSNGIPRGDARTCAVAYGAALKANERVSFLRKWEYNLGLKGTEEKQFFWAAQISDELVEDKIYLMKKNGSKKAAHIRGKSVDELYFVGIMDKIEDAPSVPIGDTVTLDSSASVGYVMGVSMNRYKIITFYWWKLKQDIDGRTIDKRLEEFEDELNAGKMISEFDMDKSGKIEMGKLFDNVAGITGR